jgi:3-methylfumaryl-CoA hydratase
VTRVSEIQTFVYREDGAPTLAPLPEPDAEIGEVWRPDEVNLFRFSAATFNSHRIHYDAPYAAEVEGYPGLVVHGPFTAAKLAAYAGRRGNLASFAFRAQSPLFVRQPVRLQADDDEVRAIRCDGAVAMSAKVTFA